MGGVGLIDKKMKKNQGKIGDFAALAGLKRASDSVIREFKSLYPSHEELRLNAWFLYFCHKGVAGIVFETRKPLKSTVYLTQPRDSKGLFIK